MQTEREDEPTTIDELSYDIAEYAHNNRYNGKIRPLREYIEARVEYYVANLKIGNEMRMYEWTNEEWFLNLKHQENEAEGVKAFQDACAETDAFVESHELNWRIVGEILRDRRGL